MNGGAGEKQEAEKRIKEYIQASSMGLSKKEEQDFKELVIYNEETAKKVFQGSNHTGKVYILIYLNSQGKGADIAKEEAAAWAGQMEFINSNPLEERAFRSWLSGETDIMPETMPVNKYIMGFPHRKNVELCYMLLILAAAMGYLSFRYLSAILPADSYEDKGVYTFSPYQVLPVQVQNTGASGRDRRMNPTKTAYMVYYQDISGSGYQWSEQALTRELGQKIVDAGTTVERRVLAIPADRSYITVEPDQTAESYTAGLRKKYITALVLAGVYVLLYVAAWCVIGGMKRRTEQI